MSEIGNGYIRTTARAQISVSYSVKRDSGVAYHVVIDSQSSRVVRKFSADRIGNAQESFSLRAGEYSVDWAVVVLADGALVVIEIAIDGETRFRRERTYASGSVTPWGIVYIDVE